MSQAVSTIPADWPAPPGIVAGCTLRKGGVSGKTFESLNLGAHVGDQPENVAENRQRFLASCRAPQEPVWLNQVHSNSVVIDPDSDAEPKADAVLSRKSDTVCAVLTADCLPVLFVTRSGDEIAAAHAGWRGLCAGVLEATIAAFSAPPDSLLAWLGPAISQSAFEVGGEVRDAFLEQGANADSCFVRNGRGKWQADLYQLAQLRLAAAGVVDIYGGGLCTFSQSDRYFSYRRDGQCGRMASYIFREA
jgi:YfiH family protein